MKTPKVYIILLNYLGWKDTISCLESLLKLNYYNYEIVLVDNCSPNDSVKNIQAWARGEVLAKPEIAELSDFVYPLVDKPIYYNLCLEDKIKLQANNVDTNNKLTIIIANSNRGYSAGNNIGINYGLSRKDADFFWILNNDTLVTPATLSELVKCHQQQVEIEKIGIVGAKLMYYYSPHIIQCLGGATYNSYLGLIKQVGNGMPDNYRSANAYMELDYIAGACMLVSTDFIHDVGLLAEEYFLYFEEIDWCTRGKSKGWGIAYTPQACIYHKESASSRDSIILKINKSKTIDYYYIRSKLIYTYKYKGFFQNITIRISLLVTIIKRLIKGQYNFVLTIVTLSLKNPLK